jgi:hypothetical protein
MATEAQIAANRLNAQKSTGPRTDEGKANSRMNSFQHGLTSLQVFPAAQQPEYDALAAGFAEHFQPNGIEEERLVAILVHAEWNQRRYRALEEQVWQTLAAEDPNRTLAEAFIADCRGAKVLDKLHRYQRDLRRTYDQALRALTDLRGCQEESGPAARIAQIDAYLNAPLPDLGFVSSLKPAELPNAPARRDDNPALRL